jgi:hypothetical protein
MTLTFENDKDDIVYALEKIISFARDSSHIFLAQSILWISSIIGLQQGLIIHIDNLQIRSDLTTVTKDGPSASEQMVQDISAEKEGIRPRLHPSRLARLQESNSEYSDSEGDSISTTETDIHNEVIENCELFLEQSKQERKATGRFTRHAGRVVNRRAERKEKPKANEPVKTLETQTEGIDRSEIRRRKAAGECQRCDWPRDRKGSHKTIDCFRWIRLEKGTAPCPKNKQYNKD